MSINQADIPLQPLGKDGPLVPRLGLGFVNIGGGVYGEKLPDQDRFAFVDYAYNRGPRFWDTADEYHDAEDLLGDWFTANPDKRKDVFIGTKFAVRNAEKGMGGMTIDSSPEYCRQAIDRSLSRLKLEYVDIYYVHRLDKKTPIEKTMEAMVELKNAGKIKHIGLSECSAASIRRAHAIHPITAVQVEYSAFTLAIEDPKIQVLRTCRELGIAIVAFSPLGMGMLTGTLRSREDFTKPGDLRAMVPWLKEENLQDNNKIVDKIAQLAEAKGATAAQFSLAWLLAQGNDIFPIPSTTKPHRLDENVGSLQITVSAEDDQAVRAATKDLKGGRVHDLNPYAFADTPALA